MKMINDMDMYYANLYTTNCRPMWMKDERFDYCDQLESSHGSLFTRLFHRKMR